MFFFVGTEFFDQLLLDVRHVEAFLAPNELG